MKAKDDSVYQAVCKFAEDLAPEISMYEQPGRGKPLMVDYKLILRRKKELLVRMLMGDEYDALETRRRKIQVMDKSSKRVGKGKSA